MWRSQWCAALRSGVRSTTRPTMTTLDFLRFLKTRPNGERFNGLQASEAVLAREWDTPEEDAAWANL
jgi:hypothetical protein